MIVYDPAESVFSHKDETADLPYEDLFKDCEDCGPKVHDGVAKRIDNACTKKPAKEQFTKIQAKHLRPENCEYLKVPRVNPELWDDLLDKVKSRDVGFQAFQKGLIKGIVPEASLASKLVEAKKNKAQSIPVADAYNLAIDALTLLGNSVFEFSMKRREMLKSEVAPGFKSLCHESQPITTMLFGDELPQSIRDISQVKRMAAKSVTSSKRNKMPFSRDEKECISVEVGKLLGKGAIRRASFHPNQFLSNLFTIPKKGGELRPVINLKPLNHFVEYHHFKMEGLTSLLDLIRSNDYMITMDLKDAYLSVPTHVDHSKYLRFEWESELWEFTCLPFGLSSAPRVFTKVMKPVIGKVRSQGIRSVIYLDDMAVLSRSIDQSNLDSQFVIETLQSVGFLINWEKSILKPCQRIQFLGFTIDSSSMAVSLPQEKLNKLVERASATLHHSKRSVREVAEVIGLIVSSFPAIKLARLHYRHLQFSKINALKENLNNFNAACSLSQGVKDELEWFSTRCHLYNGTSIKKRSSVMVLTTDASQSGWGVTFEWRVVDGRKEATHQLAGTANGSVRASKFSLLVMRRECNQNTQLRLRMSTTRPGGK
ncbi:uncharacterized protein [Montipora foliosa]|uniref:uncharacterized protein n=1 Tax=Montipora foliosa TaxID=591990 RepID=UPI0035F200AD